MAAVSVNFLRRRRQQVVRTQQLDRRILLVAITVAVISVLITLVTAVYQQLLLRQLSQTIREQRTAQAVVNQQSANEAAYLLYSTRLNILKALLEGRGSQGRALSFLSQMATSELTFDRVSYDDSKQELTFRVQAQNVLAVENFIERLREPDIRPQFTDLQLSDVRRNEEQVYTIEAKVRLASSQETRSQSGRT